MKTTILKLFAVASMAVLSQGCVKDLQDEINNGNWNHERQVLEIKFENQVGLATIETIDATSGTIDIAINVGAVPDLSDIRLESVSQKHMTLPTT